MILGSVISSIMKWHYFCVNRVCYMNVYFCAMSSY